jgi:hypothetical protein
VTFPAENLFPGAYVAGFADAWDAVLATWKTHADGRAPERADAVHVETHVLAERDVFITDDRPLLAMCQRLREEHGVPVLAMSLAEYLEGRTTTPG